MASLLNATTTMLSDGYNFYLWTLSIADKRTRGWLMVDSPLPTLAYTVLYLIMVMVGPKLMKNRKPFDLKKVMIAYNLSMCVLNAFIAVELLVASTRLKYNYICQPVTFINHKEEIRIANAVWWYYISKLFEFGDTLFFVLRKKDRQLSFLHVYHHATMFSLWWIGIKWVPSGSTFLPAMVNSFIHVLMYSYYGLAALGPHVARYLWWKKYLTILQLIQFTVALIMGVNSIRSGCDFPMWMQYALVVYMVSFIVLFGNFYAKAYIKKGRESLAFYGAANMALCRPSMDLEVENRKRLNGNGHHKKTQ
ncbi:elongation of very long chain fatty acids protein 4-like [Thrips palmi]|uniref:Elongation of very long chain fatty acids protein n=1 Tax=Thrips palmi TaxID=161013 RepID=A0A6P8YKV8_THRPL|nr:elongation of very long chain fatty acids protein 4-like [Thrips palmi]XP_034240498.1 elongation of very long chain fatty acids protein 4-like [Thrips palmi]